MSPKTKEVIVSTASKLFGRYGFYKTSMDEIAKLARKAKGSLYYHFESKEDLFKEVVSQELDILKFELNKIIQLPHLNAAELLIHYLNTRMEILSKSYNYHETLKADLNDRFAFLDDIRTELTLWEQEKLRIIIHKGITEGAFDTTLNFDVAIDVFILILKSSEIQFFVQNRYEEYAPHFDELLGIVIKGLKP
jgi:AcrR family transcriptional regulator